MNRDFLERVGASEETALGLQSRLPHSCSNKFRNLFEGHVSRGYSHMVALVFVPTFQRSKNHEQLNH